MGWIKRNRSGLIYCSLPLLFSMAVIALIAPSLRPAKELDTVMLDALLQEPKAYKNEFKNLKPKNDLVIPQAYQPQPLMLIRDLLESKQIGVNYVVAPMVETPYALTKYVAAKNQTFNDDEQEDCDFLFNIETYKSFENRVEMAKIASAKGGVQGMVFGRVDYSGSIDLGREGINDDRVTNDVIAVAEVCKASKLDLVVGGGVSADSIACLRKIRAVHLTRFETRKVVFGAAALDNDSIEAGLLNAVHFELLWLMNKRDYYGSIEREDAKRIEMLDARWKILNKK